MPSGIFVLRTEASPMETKWSVYYPKDFTEIIIEGGCHSYFGMYGLMENDGTPTISNIDQIEFTSNELSKLME
jgi:hypothetical protein